MSGIYVNTACGVVRGKAIPELNGMVSFRAVPYAQPPVGRLRWCAPVKKEPWSGILDCTAYPHAAWGPGSGGEPYISDFHYEGKEPMSEDCLYVNIDTAFEAGENRPVYVWFHGGGLLSGSSYEVEFDALELVRRGVVVVSVGQRLGLFGYLALPQLKDAEGHCGNYGFLDQVMALSWVRENIAAFGGDPDNITIGGQSGGSQKCCLMAASPLSHGMFRRMILQSGLKYRQKTLSYAQAFEKSRACLAAMGVDADLSAQELRAIPAEAFMADHALYRKFAPASMVNDGWACPWDDLKDAVDAGMFDGIDILCGTTLGEAATKNCATKAEALGEFEAMLGDKFPEFEKLCGITDDNAFLKYRTLTTMGLIPNGRVTFSRNLALIRLFADKMQKRDPGHKRFNYLFSLVLPTPEEEIGTNRDNNVLLAWHAIDLWYCFASIREGRPPKRTWREKDYQLAGAMCSYFANFIANGDPNGENLPPWPEGSNHFGYMDLGEHLTAVCGKDDLDALIFDYVRKEYEI